MALTTRSGGAYIPPARLRELQSQIKDKSGEAYQRITWDALKKSINGLINKVNNGSVVVLLQSIMTNTAPVTG